MNDNHDVDRSIRELWEADMPTSDFADRVMARLDAPTRPRTGTRFSRIRATAIATGLVAMAAALLLWVGWPRSQRADGSVVADARQTIALGSRALAVLERGTALAWKIADDGSARVEQSSGSAFYRVESGQPFAVETPYGQVSVTGTCFTVEVIPMNTMAKVGLAALVGTVVTGAVIVSVHEGSVELEEDGSKVAVAAGEYAVAKDGRARLLGTDDDSRSSTKVKSGTLTVEGAMTQLRQRTRELDELRSRESEQLEEIEALEAEIERLGGVIGGDASPKAKAVRCMADPNAPGCDLFAEPSQELLMEMAHCGMITVDTPSFLRDESLDPSNLRSPKWAAEAGLSPDESETLDSVGLQVRDRYAEQLRQLWAEIGGDPKFAEELNIEALDSVLAAKLGRDSREEIERQLARERAGLAEPPAGPARLSAAERYVRLSRNLGNDYEDAVAQTLGAERAKDLRSIAGGWPGNRTISSHECDATGVPGY